MPVSQARKQALLHSKLGGGLLLKPAGIAWRAAVVLTGVAVLFFLGVPSGTGPAIAQAAGPDAGAVNCTDPFAQGGGNLWDDLPPLLDPGKWIGYVFGQLCKAVATTFFTVANFAVQWGSGCNSTGGSGVDFFRRTPGNIWVDSSRNDWAYFFYDGQFIGAAILVQFLWMAATFLWQRQFGGQQLDHQTIVVRSLAGVILTSFSASLLDWSITLCNDFNSLFSDGLTIFQANSFQVDKGGNIFSTILALLAAAVSILLVMQMATRYIYVAFLSFIFPVSGILWTNPGTQGYARLFFASWFATVFVQPVQLGVLYITSAMKDGARVDTAMSMLFGICGSFLALGMPRILNSVLGGNIPLNGRGLLLATTLVARSAYRAGSGLVNVSWNKGGSTGSGSHQGGGSGGPVGSSGGGLSPAGLPPYAPGSGHYSGGSGTSLRGPGSSLDPAYTGAATSSIVKAGPPPSAPPASPPAGPGISTTTLNTAPRNASPASTAAGPDDNPGLAVYISRRPMGSTGRPPEIRTKDENSSQN
ncbi:MAG TPA: hypothetical protein VH186_36095 [Chloroflexia bacterium]|nr:hypothetical protein [Chloroflexia bacterium]